MEEETSTLPVYQDSDPASQVGGAVTLLDHQYFAPVYQVGEKADVALSSQLLREKAMLLGDLDLLPASKFVDVATLRPANWRRRLISSYLVR